MTIELTEEIVRSLSTAKSFERGREYYKGGAVYSASRRGDVLTGECEGSSDFAYKLQVEMDANGIRSATCTCPYEFEGICKHLVALLLKFIYEPEEFIQLEGINEMLSELDRDELVRLIDKLSERDPDLYDWLEMTIPVVKVSTKKGSVFPEKKHKAQVSEKAYRRQVSNILHSLDGYRMSEAYWMMGGMVKQLGQLVDTARAVVEAGDAEGALTILMTILEEVADSYEQFDDSDGELGGFLGELGQPLAEAILSADVSEKECRKLEKDLQPIVNELSDYGIEGLEVALAALRHGWVELGEDEGSEEEWDSAITLIDRDIGDYTLLEKVADAVIAYRPEWVIRVSCKQAEGLIEKTQSKYYAIAVHWLAKAKKAFIQSGRKPEWEAYLSNLKNTYGRRPALQAELRRL